MGREIRHEAPPRNYRRAPVLAATLVDGTFGAGAGKVRVQRYEK